LKSASGRQIAQGVGWLMLFKVADRGLGLVSTLVLARLLVPADFGLVAMATAVVALTQLMGAFGFDTALIQRQDARREHYDTVWTFEVIFGSAIAVALLIIAVPAAAFFGEPRLQLVIPVLAISALAGGFENIGTVAFRKELDFRREFRFLLAKRLASFIVTVSLAILLHTYWALIAGIVAGKFLAVLISYRLHPYRPRFTLAARADLLHFSKWIFMSNLIQFLHSRSTDFILGRIIGSHGLGIYNVAVEIAATPSSEFIAPLNRAVYPAYARLSTNLEDLRVRFMAVFGVISLVGFPVSIGVVCVADPAVRVLLGERWLEAIPIIQVIAITGLAGALQSNLYLVHLALGKPKANTLLSATLLVVALPAVIAASLHYGALGAAYAHSGVAVLGLFGIVVVFLRLTGISAWALGQAVWRPVLGCAAMACAVFATDAWIARHWEELVVGVRLVVLVTLGAASYVAAILSLWVLAGRPVSAEHVLLTAAKGKLRARGLSAIS
jgi:lipopolysaccharide exporter